jgi:ATP-dependent Lon protease
MVQAPHNATPVHTGSIPDEVAILPLRNSLAFPFMIMSFDVSVPRSLKLVEDALTGTSMIGLVASKQPAEDNPVPGQVYETGTIGKIHKVIRTPMHDRIHFIVEGMERFKIRYWKEMEPYLIARIILSPEEYEHNLEMDALMQSVRDLARQVAVFVQHNDSEVTSFLEQLLDPRHLIYAVMANSNMTVEQCQEIMEIDDLAGKYHAVISYLTEKKDILSLGHKIQTEAEKKVTKAQREYFLRQQLKEIQKELGDEDAKESEPEDYSRKIKEACLPEEAKKEAERELKRMVAMPGNSAEYFVIKTYLDWLLELPWNVLSKDRLDIRDARRVLDEDHFDLDDVKERIIEFLAVRKLARERNLRPGRGWGQSSVLWGHRESARRVWVRALPGPLRENSPV